MKQWLDKKIFSIISEVSDSEKIESYAIGGFVRDCFIGRNCKDIDIVAVGSGIELARRVCRKDWQEYKSKCVRELRNSHVALARLRS